jgi:hypothetical protein
VELTILGMEVSDLEGVFAPFYNAIVPFLEIRRRREFRSGELHNRAQKEPEYRKPQDVEAEDSEKLDGDDDPALVESGVSHCCLSLQVIDLPVAEKRRS